jgi:hypothetical protein
VGGADVSLLRSADFARTGVVYVRTTTAILGSRDGGRTFLPLVVPRPADAAYTAFPAAVLGAGSPQPLYVAELSVVGSGASRLTAGGVYASSDGGTTWSVVGALQPFGGGATTVATALNGRVFAGYIDSHGGAGLVCSSDRRAWQASCSLATASCTGNCTDPSPVATIGPPPSSDPNAVSTDVSPPSAASADGTPIMRSTVARAKTVNRPTPVSVPLPIVGVTAALIFAVTISIRRRWSGRK